MTETDFDVRPRMVFDKRHCFCICKREFHLGTLENFCSLSGLFSEYFVDAFVFTRQIGTKRPSELHSRQCTRDLTRKLTRGQ